MSAMLPCHLSMLWVSPSKITRGLSDKPRFRRVPSACVIRDVNACSNEDLHYPASDVYERVVGPVCVFPDARIFPNVVPFPDNLVAWRLSPVGSVHHFLLNNVRWIQPMSYRHWSQTSPFQCGWQRHSEFMHSPWKLQSSEPRQKPETPCAYEARAIREEREDRSMHRICLGCFIPAICFFCGVRADF